MKETNMLKKTITSFFLLLLCSSLFAQKQVMKAVNTTRTYAKALPVAALNRATVLEPLDNIFTERNTAVQFEADAAVLTQIEKTQPKFLEFSMPISEDKTMVLELIPMDIFGDKYKVMNAQNQAVKVQKGVFYKGIVKGDDNSVVSLSLSNGELSGIISNDNGNYILGKIKNASNYVFYNDHELLEKSKFDCAVEETIEHNIEQTRQLALTETLVCSPRPVQIYFEADNSIFVAQGSNMTTATNFVNALFAQVAVLYANEGIAIQISQLKIWDTADPYISAGGFYATHQMLNLFVAQVGTTFTGDLAHLISARVLGGGVADSFESLCNKGAAISANITSTVVNVPVYSWNVLVVTHELGHNFGSPHTHSCFWPGGAIDNCEFTEGGCWSGPAPVNGGTIMSYCHQVKGVGTNFANGFGPLPGNMIRSRANFCIYTSKLEVTVISTSANTTAACNGFQIVVSATGGTGAKTFSASPNVGSQAVSGTFTGLSPDTYVFTTTDANGCTATISTTIPAPAAPSVQAAVAICNNDNTSITATSAGNTIKWFDATGTNELFTGATFTTPNLTTNTAYKVRSQSGNGCFSPFVDIAVTVNPKPAAPVITSSSGANCGTVTLTANVPNNNALNFVKTSSQYVNVPHHASLNLGATFTMEAWVNYSGANSTIVDKGNYNFLWSLNANSNGNKMGFYTRNTTAWVYSTGTVPENTWTHVAITLNAGTLTFYINGVASGTAPVSFSQDTEPMNIGRQQPTPTGCRCNHFNGSMDELRLWNVAKTAAQLQASKYNSVPTNSAGLVAYYKFDEGTGTTTADASGNGNNGTLVGTTWQVPSTSPLSAVVWSLGGATTRSIVATTSGTYTATVRNEYGCTNSASIVVTATCDIKLTIKVFLEGPYNTTTHIMNDNLRSGNLIPQTETFTEMVSSYFMHKGGGGGETTTPSVLSVTGPNAIIDWVFLELRDPSVSTTVLQTRSALLQADGDVVDTDGTSPVRFTNSVAGNYFIAVKHRNHLRFRTLNAVALTTGVNTLNFTNNSIPMVGTNPLKQVEAGVYGLYSGDLYGQGSIDAGDRSDVWNYRNVTGYNNFDCNMNGTVDATDRSNVWNNRNIISPF
jgi:Concanavalin A-like lectin/glucanases superfamily/Metallo-peptidase family M12/Ig-like domain CHU_C associated